jgi:hypothetical protein
MKILKGNFGKCIFVDNMDKDVGLPSLKEKSWDLCLTDPPYNIKWNGFDMNPVSEKRDLLKYEDNMNDEDYRNWCINWFNYIKNISNRSSILIGLTNLQMWMKFDDEFGLVIWNNPIKQGSAKGCYFSKYEPILTYNIKPPKCFKVGIFRINPREHEYVFDKLYIHSCPKSINIWEYFVKQLKPTSVLDPFLGSGTTAQCCEEMGIPWLGYEIMEEYAPDIEKRIALGIKSHESYMRSKKIQKRLDL